MVLASSDKTVAHIFCIISLFLIFFFFSLFPYNFHSANKIIFFLTSKAVHHMLFTSTLKFSAKVQGFEWVGE